MVSRPDGLASVWKSLKPIFDKMLTMQDISKIEHLSIYNGVYGYCISADNSVKTNNEVLGYELYKKLRSYFKQHVQSLRTKGEKKDGSDLLTFYEKNWTNFRVAVKFIDNRCKYLNQHWVKNKAEEGRRDIDFIYDLALSVWRDDLLKPCKDALQTAVLREIENERNGESIAATRLNTIISSLVDLCSTGERTAEVNPAYARYPVATTSACPPARQHSNTQMPGHALGDLAQPADWRQNPPIYREYFEQPFLRETMHFYDVESNEFLKSNSCTDYLKRVESRMEEERNRAHSYLHGSTLNELIKTCEQSLIGNHIETLTAEFPNLLMDNRIEDLARMYKALGRFAEGEARLVDIMESHVDKVGSEAIREVAQTAKSNPKLFVDTIVAVQRKGKHLLQSAFSNNAAFSRALDKGCERFINRNAVTSLSGSSRKTPELLAKYADVLLKKGTGAAQPGDLEEILNNVMEVFKYVEDKDVFQKFYSNMLARRLVCNLSVSEDSEAQMISLLKGACGFEYTSKLQRMFHDISSSRELSGRFDDWVKRSADASTILYGVDFSIMVLSSNAWPFQAHGGFTVPIELEKCVKVFLEFYQFDHEGRKLSWCYQLSRGEVVTHYTKMRHTFQVSTFQMAILMLYNSALAYSVSQIQSQTGIEMGALIQTLQILLKVRVLKVEETTPASTALKPGEAEELTPDTVLGLYTDYNNEPLLPSQCVTSTEAAQEQHHHNHPPAERFKSRSWWWGFCCLKKQPKKPASVSQVSTTTAINGGSVLGAGPMGDASNPALSRRRFSKRIRVNLNLPVKSEAKQESETTLNTVESDRKLSIQACIVRIMKMRKRMEHQQLIKEVIEQMSSRFSPQIPQIKLCINSLIEREFIKRDPNNNATYEYIA